MSAPTPTDVWPSGFERYRPLGVLGRGGAGVVWHAEDAETGRAVALKTLRARDRSEREAFSREIYALSVLDHPGVVRVLGHGVTDGCPWFAMELVVGQRLDTFLAARPPRARALRCLRELCATLRYVHGEGIVHRDLKPSNIFVREDGSTTLIDFGVASQFAPRGGGELLRSAVAFAGSLVYASPEQLRGAFVDARADLYALGCILYEVLTLSPPFVGQPHQIYAGHLQRPPVPPHEVLPEVPEPLSRLAMSLLAKDPRERLGYAEDVLEALDDALTAEGGLPPHHSAREPARLGRPYLYRADFAGRAPALSQLIAALHEMERGRGGLLFVSGDSGIGKTRLMMELTRFVHPETLVVTSECTAFDQDSGPTSQMAVWRALLRVVADVTRADGPAAVERVLGARASALAQFEPALLSLAAQPLTPAVGAAARDRLLEAFAQTVEAFTEDRPVLVILDDLQWADELSFAALERLSRGALAARNLLVVGGFRADEAKPELEALARPGLIRLQPMDAAAVSSILADSLALREVPEALTSFLASASEGNPFFINEYLHEAADAGVLTRQRGGSWRVDGEASLAAYGKVGVPLTIRSLVGRRISRLSADAVSFAEAAAVLGRQFEPALAARMAGTPRVEVTVHELLARRMVETFEPGGLRFCHDKLREVVYGELDADKARRLHLSAAREIERAATSEQERSESYAQLAHHYERARKAKEAMKYFGLAGEQAFARGAYADAHQFLSKALAGDEAPTRDASTVRARWHRINGNAAFALGDLESSIEQTVAALGRCGQRLPTTTVGWAWMACRNGLRVLLGSFATGSGAEAARLREESIAATQLAASYYYDARLIPSVASVLCGVVAAQRSDDASCMADACSRLGYVLGAARLGAWAEQWFERARAAGLQSRDPSALALSYYMDAMYRVGIGQWERAQQLGRESQRLSLGAGNVQEAEVAQTIAAHAYYYSGRVEEARAEYASILQSASRRGNRQHVGWGLFLSGRSALASGAIGEANELLEAGYAQLLRLPDAVSLAMCEGLLASAALRAGRITRAAELADETLARLRSGRRPAVGQCLDAYGELAHVSVALHARAGTAGTLQRARRALTELSIFASCFPIAKPALLRTKAELALAGGEAGRARRLLRRARAEATTLGMSVERAAALDALERIQPRPLHAIEREP